MPKETGSLEEAQPQPRFNPESPDATQEALAKHYTGIGLTAGEAEAAAALRLMENLTMAKAEELLIKGLTPEELAERHRELDTIRDSSKFDAILTPFEEAAQTRIQNAVYNARKRPDVQHDPTELN